MVRVEIHSDGTGSIVTVGMPERLLTGCTISRVKRRWISQVLTRMRSGKPMRIFADVSLMARSLFIDNDSMNASSDESVKSCGKKRRWLKPVLCGLLLVGGVLCGMGTWGFVHCEIFSRQEFREFTEESNRSSFGLTRYVGRLNGYDYFQVRLVFREKTLRVSAEESPVKEPYPLRLWPGNWRTGWFRNEVPGSEWFMWR